jgi:hypothetical protein
MIFRHARKQALSSARRIISVSSTGFYVCLTAGGLVAGSILTSPGSPRRPIHNQITFGKD